MTDYSELIEALRFCVRWHRADDALANAEQAAAAIEDLQAEEKSRKENCEKCSDATRRVITDLQGIIADLRADLPKRGEWIKGSDGLYHCSECGKTAPYIDAFDGVIQYWEPLFFCNNCGAKMEAQDGQD